MDKLQGNQEGMQAMFQGAIGKYLEYIHGPAPILSMPACEPHAVGKSVVREWE